MCGVVVLSNPFVVLNGVLMRKRLRLKKKLNPLNTSSHHRQRRQMHGPILAKACGHILVCNLLDDYMYIQLSGKVQVPLYVHLQTSPRSGLEA